MRRCKTMTRARERSAERGLVPIEVARRLSGNARAENGYGVLLDAVRHLPSDALRALSRADVLRIVLTSLGSETEDNLNAAKLIEYGPARSQRRRGKAVRGFKIAGKNVLLSDIAWEIEDLDVPPRVSEALPQLTQAEWDAAMRLVTMIFAATELEAHPRRVSSKSSRPLGRRSTRLGSTKRTKAR